MRFLCAWRRRGDDHPRRPQHAIVQQIALLKHLEHSHRVLISGRLLHDRFMQVGIKGLAQRVNPLHTMSAQGVEKLVLSELHTLDQGPLVAVLLGGGGGAFQVVESRQQVGRQRALGVTPFFPQVANT